MQDAVLRRLPEDPILVPLQRAQVVMGKRGAPYFRKTYRNIPSGKKLFNIDVASTENTPALEAGYSAAKCMTHQCFRFALLLETSRTSGMGHPQNCVALALSSVRLRTWFANRRFFPCSPSR